MATAEAAKVTFGSPVGYADKFWQIGSVTAPSTCLCCGLQIGDDGRNLKGPYERGPYRYVCSECWELPFLFFPDKVVAACGECWIPAGRSRHTHPKASAPRGARIGKVQEEVRRIAAAGHWSRRVARDSPLNRKPRNPIDTARNRRQL